MPLKSPRRTDPDPITLGAEALRLLAEEPERLARFMTLSGLGPADLRRLAAEPAFLGSVLSYVREDESLLLVLAAQLGVDPMAFAVAERALTGADDGSA